MDGSVRKYAFSCAGRSDREEMHHILVEGKEVTCSCQGVHWCSHIDATLYHGERHMVPVADRRIADAAERALRGHIGPPKDWQASWKEDRVWRGLSAPRSDEAAKMRLDGRPTICFIGSGPAGTKPDYEEAAQTLGWRTIDKPTAFTTLVVASTGSESTKSLEEAVANELPIVAHADWDEWQYDFTNAVMDGIERATKERNGTTT